MPKKVFFNLPEKKRERIEKTAVNIFSKKGYQKTTVNKIVKESKIAKGSFYQYFENKYDIFLYIFKKAGELKMTYFSDVFQNLEQNDFFENLEKMYYGGLEFALDYPKYTKIINDLMKKNKEILNKIYDDNTEEVDKIYKKLLNIGIKKGEIRDDLDIDYMSHLIMHTGIATSEYFLSNVFEKVNETKDKDKLLDFLNQYISFLKKGIGVPKGENNE